MVSLVELLAVYWFQVGGLGGAEQEMVETAPMSGSQVIERDGNWLPWKERGLPVVA